MIRQMLLYVFFRCQPWTIVVTGLSIVACSWVILHSVLVSSLAVALIAAWWYIFLYSYPKVCFFLFITGQWIRVTLLLLLLVITSLDNAGSVLLNKSLDLRLRGLCSVWLLNLGISVLLRNDCWKKGKSSWWLWRHLRQKQEDSVDKSPLLMLELPHSFACRLNHVSIGSS